MNISNLSDLKRAMTVGTTVTVTNHKYPELSGKRTVIKSQAQRWYLSFPVNHPKYEGPDVGSWVTIPSASLCAFNDGSSVAISREPEWGDNGPFMTIALD